MIVAGRPAIEEDTEADGLAAGWGAEHHVEVPGLEVVQDPGAGRLRHCPLRADRPVALQSPLTQSQPRRNGVAVFGVVNLPTGRGETLGAAIAHVGLRRLHQDRVGRGLGSSTDDGDDAAGDIPSASLGQEALNDLFLSRIVAFAEMMGA